jgi:Zn-dependent M32 family carboxypeptidase
MSTKL